MLKSHPVTLNTWIQSFPKFSVW